MRQHKILSKLIPIIGAGFTNLRLQVILFLFMELILFGIIIKKIVNKINNDGLIFLVIMTSFYVINLYICNDFFIRLIG